VLRRGTCSLALHRGNLMFLQAAVSIFFSHVNLVATCGNQRHTAMPNIFISFGSQRDLNARQRQGLPLLRLLVTHGCAVSRREHGTEIFRVPGRMNSHHLQRMSLRFYHIRLFCNERRVSLRHLHRVLSTALVL
jgi:hypothetical protein